MRCNIITKILINRIYKCLKESYSIKQSYNKVYILNSVDLSYHNVRSFNIKIFIRCSFKINQSLVEYDHVRFSENFSIYDNLE